MTALVDTNVMIALLDQDHPCHEWSINELTRRKLDGPVIVSDLVYCEVSIGMTDRVAVDEAIRILGLERTGMTHEAPLQGGACVHSLQE